MNNELVQPSIRKYDFIDSLRGLAILGVVFIHTSQWVTPSSTILIKLAQKGQLGVQLFYIASALTLFMSMSTRQQVEKNPRKNFFIRRFFRIAPLFYLAIIIYLLIYGFSPRYWAPNGIGWWYVPLTALFLHGWNPETINSVVPGGWSIAVEMTFYLLVPFLYHYIKDIKSSLFFVFISLLLSKILSFIGKLLIFPHYHYPENQQYLVDNFLDFWFFSQLPIFALGILTYYIFRRYQNYKNKKNGLILICVSCLIFVSIPLLAKTPLTIILPYRFLYSISFCIFAIALHIYPTNKIFVNFLTQNLGKLSYSIYLTHFAVLEVAHHVHFLKADLGFMFGFLLVLFFSFAISSLTYQIIEIPGINLGKTLIKKSELVI